MSRIIPSLNFVTVEAKSLAKAMKLATAIIEKHVSIPILASVRICFDQEGLTIEATDLDLSAKIKVDEIEGDGVWSTCLTARDLTAIAAAAGVMPIRIAPSVATGGKDIAQKPVFSAVVEAGEATYQLRAHDPDDYPTVGGEQMQRIERFSNGQLAAMLKKVSFCISTEETRYYLNGVNWSAKDAGLRFTATDGHRLAAYRYAANEAEASFSYIIPRKACGIIAQFLDGADVEVFSVGNGNAIVDTRLDLKASGVTLRMKLIDGTYPDFDRVIPREENHSLDVRQDEILAAINQATAIGGWRGQAIRLQGLEGRLSVEVKSPDDDTAKVKTSALWPEGLSEFGVNSRYMSDVVKQCQGSIRFGMAAAGAPITVSDEDTSMTRIVMPMRV